MHFHDRIIEHCIWIQISLVFVPENHINIKSVLVWIMVWYQMSNKPSSWSSKSIMKSTLFVLDQHQFFCSCIFPSSHWLLHHEVKPSSKLKKIDMNMFLGHLILLKYHGTLRVQSHYEVLTSDVSPMWYDTNCCIKLHPEYVTFVI